MLAENGLELLNSVDPPRPTFIPSLDAAAPRLLSPDAMVEVQGPAGSGKTNLVLFLCLTRLLPHSVSVRCQRPLLSEVGRVASSSSSAPRWERRWIDVELGGLGPGSVLLFDADGRFPLDKLRAMLHAHVADRVRSTVRASPASLPPQLRGTGTMPWNPPSDDEVGTLVEAWMERLVLWRPGSDVEMRASMLAAVEASGRRTTDMEEAEGELLGHHVRHASLIVVDSVSSFLPQLELQDTLRPGTLRSSYSSLLRCLLSLQRATLRRAAIVYTNWAVSEEEQHQEPNPIASSARPLAWRPPATASSAATRGAANDVAGPLPGGRFWKQHLPSPWPELRRFGERRHPKRSTAGLRHTNGLPRRGMGVDGPSSAGPADFAGGGEAVRHGGGSDGDDGRTDDDEDNEDGDGAHDSDGGPPIRRPSLDFPASHAHICVFASARLNVLPYPARTSLRAALNDTQRRVALQRSGLETIGWVRFVGRDGQPPQDRGGNGSARTTTTAAAVAAPSLSSRAPPKLVTRRFGFQVTPSGFVPL